MIIQLIKLYEFYDLFFICWLLTFCQLHCLQICYPRQFLFNENWLVPYYSAILYQKVHSFSEWMLSHSHSDNIQETRGIGKGNGSKIRSICVIGNEEKMKRYLIQNVQRGTKMQVDTWDSRYHGLENGTAIHRDRAGRWRQKWREGKNSDDWEYMCSLLNNLSKSDFGPCGGNVWMAICQIHRAEALMRTQDSRLPGMAITIVVVEINKEGQVKEESSTWDPCTPIVSKSSLQRHLLIP